MSFFALVFIIVFGIYSSSQTSYGAYSKAEPSANGPVINDPNLTVETITSGLKIPTSMAFLGNNDILVTEKNTGRVMEVLDGEIQEDPVLDVQVAAFIERGLLGIALSKHDDGRTYAFLYYTESGGGKDADDFTNGVEPVGNMLYRYEYVDGKLINPVLLLNLPAEPGTTNRTDHNGGKVLIGPDNNVYVVIGEVGGHRTIAQNIEDGPNADGTGGILRITQGGQAVQDNTIFGDELPLSIYYAMGIRNSFGMDFDPLTGNLWDTENGAASGDEINLVEPGFNSGWALVQGYEDDDIVGTGAQGSDLAQLGDGQYSDPEFVWNIPIGITDAKFLNSDKLGTEYQNDLFTADINNGYLYRLSLNGDRNGILLDNTFVGDLQSLSDNAVDNAKESEPLIFGQGFGGITDIEVGPDGYLYVLSYAGDLYRILPTSASSTPKNQPAASLQNDPVSASPPGAIPASIVGIADEASYSPNPIEIEAGQTITWNNDDLIGHTVTSGSADSDAGSLFDSGNILTQQTYSVTFEEPGDFEYFCIYHPTMVGEVHVN
jgi:glucose/arabinose dehydrogenase/plastocyanin